MHDSPWEEPSRDALAEHVHQPVLVVPRSIGPVNRGVESMLLEHLTRPEREIDQGKTTLVDDALHRPLAEEHGLGERAPEGVVRVPILHHQLDAAVDPEWFAAGSRVVESADLPAERPRPVLRVHAVEFGDLQEDGDFAILVGKSEVHARGTRTIGLSSGGVAAPVGCDVPVEDSHRVRHTEVGDEDARSRGGMV